MLRIDWTGLRRRGGVCALLACLWLFGCGAGEPRGGRAAGSEIGSATPIPSAAPLRARRVVLVTIDTLRADRVGSRIDGIAVTPRMDGFAAEGARFTNAISPVPVTMPSHATIMTGLQPTRHGVRANGTFTLAEDVPTLATRLRARGFATAAFVGAMVLNGHYGLAQGFDLYDDEMGTRRALGAVGYPERRASEVVDRAIEWLETAPEAFLLWAHFYDPHMAHEPPPGHRLRFPTDLYAAEIHFADEQLGRLVDSVRERFGTEETLVVVTSDHGESLGDHGEASHSYTLYDSTQRVPLLVMGPGVPAGRTVPEVVRLADIAPTVLAAVGEVPDEGLDGRDMLPLARGVSEAPRVAWVETLATRIEQGWSPLYGLRTKRFKYIHAPRPELYAIEQDAEELVDLAAALPEVAAGFEAQIEARLATQRPIRMNGEMDPEERRQLEALGYIIPEDTNFDAAAFEVGGTDPKDVVGDLKGLARALLLAQEGDFAAALAAVEAVRGSGGHLSAYRSRYARMSGDLEKAERYGRRAVAEAPGWAETHLEMAYTLVRLGQEEAARAAFARAAELAPGNPAPHLALGTMAMLRDDLENATAHLERAVSGDSEIPEAYWRLAALRFADGRNEEAEALLAEIPPGLRWSPEVVTNLVVGLVRSDQRDSARRRVRQALRRRPKSQELRGLLRELDEAAAALDPDTLDPDGEVAG